MQPSPGRGELERALAGVEQADRRLEFDAREAYQHVRSATLAGAIVIGIGAGLIGTLAGSEQRRRFATGAVGIVLPFLVSAVAEAAGQLARSKTSKEKSE